MADVVNDKICPVCGHQVRGVFCTCERCGWCNDPVQRENPDLENMVENKMSLNEARKAYKEGRPIE